LLVATMPEAVTDDRVRRFFPLGAPHPRVLSRAQIRQFNERGYLFPLEVFDTREVTALRAYCDDLFAKALAAGFGSYDINGWHCHCAGLYDLCTEPRVLDLVQDLLGEDLILWGTHFFLKQPGDRKQVSWHQDASYWPLSPSKTVTVWLAIDDSDAGNGAMRVIPRSHVNAQLAYQRSTAEENNVLSQTTLQAEAQGDPPVVLALRAGQVSLHTDWLVHGSEPNRSARRRCGLTLRFTSADVRALKPDWARRSVICRGRDRSGHWAHHPRPAGEQIPSPKAR